ncbi:hypothetical protein KSD_35300 [Ktedonobacter sp. SOSP1-85]|uniref:hypothetical protein n=1 Tax=Ktedonobacter sp. SOSP1-85 TaxID=2778367 RepID=UPI0019166A83|nr:hypothetical protein [Ktedonobacter sp. SOSP1-85]GHO75759.1 hypothetical protein KSD_35300 [Ktedonobacter sp. SOSP1-85]
MEKAELVEGVDGKSLSSPSAKSSQTYTIQKRLISPATIVLKVADKTSHKCIKLWRPFKNDIYDTVDTNKNNIYTLQGLAFNRQFAPEVYLGIAPIISPFHEYARTITLGTLLSAPTEDDLKANKKYAVVMDFLNQDWRLDQQIRRRSLPTEEDIEFLAKEIAHMHEQARPVSSSYGSLEELSNKWELNKKHLKEALTHPSLERIDKTLIKSLNISASLNTMDNALEIYKKEFLARSLCLKHCHGDLKTNNLWLIPKPLSVSETKQNNAGNDTKLEWKSKRLKVLDCIDFNPLFSYIDPLSDAAMLIMDLEEQLTSLTKTDLPKRCGDAFLKEYLTHTTKNTDTFDKGYLIPIMEFYIAEKAIVCAYVSILSDRRPHLGLRYLLIAQKHINTLSNIIKRQKQATASTERFIIKPAYPRVSASNIFITIAKQGQKHILRTPSTLSRTLS